MGSDVTIGGTACGTAVPVNIAGAMWDIGAGWVVTCMYCGGIVPMATCAASPAACGGPRRPSFTAATGEVCRGTGAGAGVSVAGAVPAGEGAAAGGEASAMG